MVKTVKMTKGEKTADVHTKEVEDFERNGWAVVEIKKAVKKTPPKVIGNGSDN